MVPRWLLLEAILQKGRGSFVFESLTEPWITTWGMPAREERRKKANKLIRSAGCDVVIITGMIFRTVSDHKHIKNQNALQTRHDGRRNSYQGILIPIRSLLLKL
jgi:hypothetical protein